MNKELTETQKEDIKAINLMNFTQVYLTEVFNLPISLDEYVARLYIAHRMQPTLNLFDISENRFNNLCELVYQAYATYNVSLDILVNAIINYITEEQHSPANKDLTEELDLFLDNYGYTQKKEK